MSAKDRIKEELDGGGSVSANDFASFTPNKPKEGEEAEAPKADALEEDSVLDVVDEAKQAPAETAGNSGKDAQTTLAKKMDRLSDLFDFKLDDKVTLTPTEKTLFLESIVTGGRFELPFSIFNGKLTGTFRSRNNRESDAQLAELQRRCMVGDIVTDAEYVSAFRSCSLRFQLSYLRGSEMETPSEPLVHQTVFDEKGEAQSMEPTWFDEGVNLFKDEPDGVVAALYKQLLIFERKYWTMVKNAENQNFWNPEDSTSE